MSSSFKNFIHPQFSQSFTLIQFLFHSRILNFSFNHISFIYSHTIIPTIHTVFQFFLQQSLEAFTSYFHFRAWDRQMRSYTVTFTYPFTYNSFSFVQFFQFFLSRNVYRHNYLCRLRVNTTCHRIN